MKVDFPDPDGPTIAMNSEPAISVETPRKASISTSPRRNTFVTSCASMTGALMARARSR